MNNPTLSELRKESDREDRRLPRWIKWCSWLVALVGLWVVAGFWVVPPVLRGQLEKRLSEQLHRRVTVGKVRLNPLTLSISLESFAVAEPSGGPFIGWRRLFVDFDSFSFLMREWRFQEIALDGFSGNIAVAKDGRLNFADLMGSSSSATANSPSDRKPWPLFVRRLVVSGARLSYRDASRTEPFSTDFGPTGFSLLNFHTGGPKQAPGEFAATTESGETFAWHGTLSFVPLRSSGEIALGKIALKKYAPYYSDRVKFDLRDGQLDVSLHYDFALDDGKSSLRVSNGRVAIQSLQIARRGVGEPVIALQQIELTDLAATWPKISAEAGRLAVTGGSITMQRTAEGIDLVELLTPVVPAVPPAVATAPVAASAAVPPPVDVKVNEISIRDLAVTLDDRTTPRPARHELTGLTFDLRNLSLANLAAPLPFGVRAKLAPEGLIHAAGTIALSPLKAELGLELNAISLANISPYVESFANMRIVRGQLTTALNLRLELPVGSAPVVAAQGDINVDDFAAYDAASVDEIVGWRIFAIKGFEYSSAPPAKLMISEVNWVEPAGHLIVNDDHTLNLAVALEPPGAPAPVVAMPGAPAPRRDKAELLFIAIDRFVLENAGFDFVDRSLQPNVRVSLNQLSGGIDGLASSELARATINLRGKVDGVAPVTVTGKINPLSAHAFTDLKVTMKAIELIPAGPYVGKFAGYELARGSLNLDVKCRVAQRKIDCTNVVTIDQFTFGNATNSPDATTLPVRLAVALLRDTAGRIVLDVPVQGSLDDPDIRSGRVIWRVITNLLVKVATSPFSLLGPMFGGEQGQDLSFLQCAAGETGPASDGEIKKLDVVARALLGRPTLQLEIVGGYDEVADGPALREKALETEMRKLIWADRRMVEPDLTLDQVQLDPVQKMGMVRRFYYKTFPNEAPRHSSSGPGEPTPPVAGQRGNLGAFRRSEPTISRMMPSARTLPLPAPKEEILSVDNTAAGVTTPTPPEPTAPTAASAPAAVPAQPAPRAVTLDEMKAKLLARMKVGEDAFRRLAAERSNEVREYLVSQGQVPAERVSLAEITAETPAAKGSRVELRLK